MKYLIINNDTGEVVGYFTEEEYAQDFIDYQEVLSKNFSIAIQNELKLNEYE